MRLPSHTSLSPGDPPPTPAPCLSQWHLPRSMGQGSASTHSRASQPCRRRPGRLSPPLWPCVWPLHLQPACPADEPSAQWSCREQEWGFLEAPCRRRPGRLSPPLWPCVWPLHLQPACPADEPSAQWSCREQEWGFLEAEAAQEHASGPLRSGARAGDAAALWLLFLQQAGALAHGFQSGPSQWRCLPGQGRLPPDPRPLPLHTGPGRFAQVSVWCPRGAGGELCAAPTLRNSASPWTDHPLTVASASI